MTHKYVTIATFFSELSLYPSLFLWHFLELLILREKLKSKNKAKIRLADAPDAVFYRKYSQ